MAQYSLKSTVFRKEREASWKALEKLVVRIERRGMRDLTSEETLKLQSLYRVVLSSLSVARNVSLDLGVLAYLEALAARAYFCVYGPRTGFCRIFGSFFAKDFPAAVRAIKLPVMLSALVLLAGTATGFLMTFNESDWFHAFVSEDMAEGRTPSATRDQLSEIIFTTDVRAKEFLHVFASFLFTHNAKVGFLAFALGFAFGIPTVLLLFINGLPLGAFVALHWQKDLGVEFLGWLGIHGTTELLAVILCGGAGIAIGGATIFPGRKTRLESLTATGRKAAVVVIGTVVMFLAAGLLEGFGRQLITGTTDRFLIGSAALACWLAYFMSPGRRG